jgi:heptosyltransferase-3
MNVAEPKRILIYRLGSLGDTVVALPAFHLIERAFPNAERLLLTNVPVHAKAPAAWAILEGTGLVHGFLNYRVGTRKPWELAGIWREIRRFRPELLVYLAGPRGEQVVQRDEKFFRACGIRNIVGLPTGELSVHTHSEATGLWEREAARLIRCLPEFGSCDLDDPRNWDLRLTAEEEERAQQKLGTLLGSPLIACGPGTKMQAKDWGQENWRALLGRLGEAFPKHGLVMVGAREDAPVAEFSASDWRGGMKNLCGKLTPRETAAVIRQCELFLGPDSGPMHLAAAYGVPCAIAFAARELPGLWYPAGNIHRVVYHSVPCSNCSLETCTVNQRLCLTSISVEEMFEAAMEAWKNGKEARSGQLTRG